MEFWVGSGQLNSVEQADQAGIKDQAGPKT